jgi:PmbA protein
LSRLDILERAASIAAAAKAQGADAAEAFASRSWNRDVKVRSGAVDRTIETGTEGCGLRIDLHQRQGFASTTDLSPEGIEQLLSTARAISMEAEANLHGAIPGVPEVSVPDLGLWDPVLKDLDFAECVVRATAAEEAALAVSSEISPGEGSTFSHGWGEVAVSSTEGTSRAFRGTRCSIATFPVSGSGDKRQRQYWYESRRFLNELPGSEEVGRKAGERALKMTGARGVPSGRAPVIFDPLEGARFWAGLAPAFHGDSIRRKVSFLAGEQGNQVAARCVTFVDNPLTPGALGSRPFDGEGWPTSSLSLIDEGKMDSLIYDSRTAGLAGAQNTGHASRSYAGIPVPSAHAPQLMPGESSPEKMIRMARRGLYITQLIGFGMNLVTGEYSRGANGWWFENGEIAYPVHEVTISGNLREMLAGISAVGNDLVRRSAASSPTFMVESMIISGGSA